MGPKNTAPIYCCCADRMRRIEEYFFLFRNFSKQSDKSHDAFSFSVELQRALKWLNMCDISHKRSRNTSAVIHPHCLIWKMLCINEAKKCDSIYIYIDLSGQIIWIRNLKTAFYVSEAHRELTYLIFGHMIFFKKPSQASPELVWKQAMLSEKINKNDSISWERTSTINTPLRLLSVKSVLPTASSMSRREKTYGQ